MASSSSSRDHLRELLTTRYVAKNGDKENYPVESARAGCSVLNPPSHHRHHDDHIEGRSDDVVLEDHRAIHRIDETPKLITKRQRPAVLPVRDEAVKVLRKLQTTPAETLCKEHHNYYLTRWFHTTRNSEIELAEHVLLHPNQRPSFFTMQSRCLEVDDITRLILTSLLVAPKDRGQCLARFAIKTSVDMPYKVIFNLVEKIADDNREIKLSDCSVVATFTELQPRGVRSITHRMRTENCKEYGELEQQLDEQGKIMSSRATMTLSVRGQKHVQTQITYMNNSRADGAGRNRYIELEQTVKCLNRRVMIVEEPNQLIEFELDHEMTSLKMGIPPVEDLVEFLRSGSLDEE